MARTAITKKKATKAPVRKTGKTLVKGRKAATAKRTVSKKKAA